jgi:O-antigen/teichoic acid export membrane protein
MSKKLLLNSSIYVIGDIINKAVPFLMLPILTKYLTPSDYGVISSFGAFVGFLTIFIGLSLHGAINVNFFKLKHQELKIYVVNALIILLVSTMIVSMIVFIFNREITHELLLSSEWLYLAILVSLSQFITLFNTTLWIANEQPKPYILYQLSQTILVSSLSIILILGYHFDWKGQVIALSIASISFGLISMRFLYKRDYLLFKYDKKAIKNLLNFGIPMIPHQLAGWIRSHGDRIIIISLLGASATGIFAVGYQIAMIMSVLTSAFNKVWSPYLYKILSNNPSIKEKRKIVKFTYLYFVSIFILVGMLYLFSKFLFIYLIDIKFAEAEQFVIYILIANAFNGMYFMVVNYIFYREKTKELAKITFSVSILHIIMSYFMIMSFGVIGVAYSGIISMFITFIWVWYTSNQVYKMPWLYRRDNV